MYTDFLIEYMLKDKENVCIALGLTEERYNYLIYESQEEEFSEYINSNQIFINSILMGKHGTLPTMNEVSILKTKSKAFTHMDVLHSFINAIHFKLSDKAFHKDVDYSVFKDFDFEDAIFDFEEDNYMFRISKCRYQIEVGGKFYQAYQGVLTLNESATQGNLEDIFYILEFDFVFEKLPRMIFVNSKCKDCEYCRFKEFKLQSESDDMPYYGTLCGKKTREKVGCESSNLIQYPVRRTIDEIFNACLYALQLYATRRKRATNKESSNGVLVSKHKVHQPSDNARRTDSSANMLSLREYNVYERREKREYQGGHHNSPVEHERRGYYRYYKSGKVVWVNPTTVNKGKTKGIYKV